MRSLQLGIAMAMLITAPMAAYAKAGATQSNRSSETILIETDTPAVPAVLAPSAVGGQQMQAPRFIGPYELHNGLLPNGLLPNPPTYG